MNKQLLLIITILMFTSACTAGKPNRASGGSENLSQQVERHDQQIQSIMSQLGGVEQILPGQAEVWAQVQTMRQEMNSMHGQIDDLSNQLLPNGNNEFARMQERLSRLELAVQKIATQLDIETDDISPSPSNYSPAPSAPVAPSAPSAPKESAQVLYDQGLKSFDNGKYQDALIAFKDFVSAYPKHKLTANAYFWQGESYYKLKDYARAAIAYDEVINNFKGSNKMQASLLKQGFSLFHAGKKEAGKERLNDLISRYPTSPEAKRAKDFLAKN